MLKIGWLFDVVWALLFLLVGLPRKCAMVIIIDGFNLLFSVKGQKRVGSGEMNNFFAELGIYAKRRKHRLIVVLDGGDFMYRSTTASHGITVVDSGYIESADDVIKDMVNSMNLSGGLVVTSDRELRNFLHARHVDTIRSTEFYSHLKAAFSETKKTLIVMTAQPTKLEHEEEDAVEDAALTAELDRLMVEGSERLELKEGSEFPEERRGGATPKRRHAGPRNRSLRTKLGKL